MDHPHLRREGEVEHAWHHHVVILTVTMLCHDSIHPFDAEQPIHIGGGEDLMARSFDGAGLMDIDMTLGAAITHS